MIKMYLKKFKIIVVFAILLLAETIVLITDDSKVVMADSKPYLTYSLNIEEKGWLSAVKEGETAGTTGKSKRAEAIKINLKNNDGSSAVSYNTRIRNKGWQNYVTSGKVSGTEGKSLKIEAIKIKLTGTLSKTYDIYYRVHISNYGWLGWAKNNEAAGSEGLSTAIEAIQIKLVKKGTTIKQTTAYMQKPELSYRAHVSDIGWQSVVKSNNIAGTTGLGLQMEALIVNLKDSTGANGIQYRTHLSGVGWQNWKSSGKISGTTGENRAIEAIEMKLKGDLEGNYNLYYRVHIANFGWLDWASNGETAGSVGFATPIEAIQIELLPKGQSEKTGISAITFSIEAHTANKGWGSGVGFGETVGTVGEERAIEALKISCKNADGSSAISMNSHVQDLGWLGWKESGQISGTTGLGLKMEAVQLKLTGQMANIFDIYYRAHIEDNGWLGYAKNGEIAGSVGCNLRLEAIEIYIVQKGGNFSTGGVSYISQRNTDNSNSATTDTSGSDTPVPSFTLISPVPSGCKFNKKTNDSGWVGYHDINRGVSTSTPVYAIADGTVTYKQAYRTYNGKKKLTSYGNFIEFTSANGVYTAKYCHLSQFVNVTQIISSSNTAQKSGSDGTLNLGTITVKKGDILGYIGQTGNATGVHLHFELRKNGTRIDPTSVIQGLI